MRPRCRRRVRDGRDCGPGLELAGWPGAACGRWHDLRRADSGPPPPRLTAPRSLLSRSVAGLLLNTLGVYGGCDIVFDSNDVPETALDGPAGQHVAAGTVSASPPWSAAGLQPPRLVLQGAEAGDRVERQPAALLRSSDAGMPS